MYHEAFVHTATQLEWEKSKLNLQSLGLGEPRTTRTQEGIAVLAELITNSIDISRLRRVALRVIAVNMALEGADFIELFSFSWMQVNVRSKPFAQLSESSGVGAVTGGVVSTRDAVYLPGLLEVHKFLQVAIRDNRPDLRKTFLRVGLPLRMPPRLAPLFDSGWLIPPVCIPTWASDLRRLAALLAYLPSSAISNSTKYI